MDQRPVAGTCPRCGSASFTRLKVKRGAALTITRECKECGTGYTTIPAPMSSTVQAATYASGVVLILGGVLAAVLQFAAMQGSGGGGAASFPLLTVICSFVVGFSVLRTPQQMQQQREKRLKEYQASAPPGAPPPVELPQIPDAVLLSGMFGTLALTAPLVSSLLTVVVFGSAAVMFGIVALSQGHLKGRFGMVGLFGMVLGVVSLIGWGLVFVYFFQG